jgi:hypothetical protein
MKSFSILIISMLCLSVKGQTKDFYIDYPITYSKESCFKSLNHQDSMWIEELAFEDIVLECYVMKTDDSNMIITFKEHPYDVVYVIENDWVVKVYEIGYKHFWQLKIKEDKVIIRR